QSAVEARPPGPSRRRAGRRGPRPSSPPRAPSAWSRSRPATGRSAVVSLHAPELRDEGVINAGHPLVDRGAGGLVSAQVGGGGLQRADALVGLLALLPQLV